MLTKLLLGILAFGSFLFHFFEFGSATTLVENTVLSWIMIVILMCDFKLRRIPRAIAGAALLAGWVFGLFPDAHPPLAVRLIGSSFAFILMWCVLIGATHVLRRARVIGDDQFAMGAGDPWVLAVIGSFLGYALLPNIIFLGCLQGAFAYLVMPASAGIRKTFVPLGAFLCLAVLELQILPALSL